MDAVGADSGSHKTLLAGALFRLTPWEAATGAASQGALGQRLQLFMMFFIQTTIMRPDISKKQFTSMG